jgi:hypothetical protein
MRPFLPRLGNLTSSWLIFPLACVLVVIGARCWLIARYGNQTPFWDQWYDEGAFLFPKYLGGTLTFSDFLKPHNEHRVLFTRLWLLLLLVLEGYWDSVVQMLANALIFGALIALFVVAFRSVLSGTSWIIFVLFTTLIFALPWTYGTTLDGFNGQYYFLLLFSIAGIVCIVGARAFTPWWWIAALFILCSYFSMAGGVAAAMAAFSICAAQMAIGLRRGLRELSALVIIAAMAVAMVLYIPRLGGPAPYQAHSAGQFLQALIEILSWPAATGMTFVPTLFVLALITYMPAWLTSADIILSRPPLADRRWLLVGLTAWMMLLIAATAYARAAASITGRYIDMFALGLPVNAACFLYLLEAHPTLWRHRKLVTTAIAIWLLPICVGTALTIVKHTIRDLAIVRRHITAETENLRAYLDTGDIRTLQNKAEFDIPDPDPDHLATVVSQPLIRAILPPALVGEASAARAQERGLARYTGRLIETLKDVALRWGALLIPIGLALFLVGLMTRLNRRPNTGSP